MLTIWLRHARANVHVCNLTMIIRITINRTPPARVCKALAFFSCLLSGISLNYLYRQPVWKTVIKSDCNIQHTFTTMLTVMLLAFIDAMFFISVKYCDKRNAKRLLHVPKNSVSNKPEFLQRSPKRNSASGHRHARHKLFEDQWWVDPVRVGLGGQNFELIF